MNRKGAWGIRWTFEPNRLSDAILAQAYDMIVPQRVRVLRADTGSVGEPCAVALLQRVRGAK